MKIAIPIYGDNVSNVFDFAHRLLLVEIENGKAVERSEIELKDESLLQRVVDSGPNGYKGSSMPCECDSSMKFVQHRPRDIHTLFGWIKLLMFENALLKTSVSIISSKGLAESEVEESIKKQISPLRSLCSLRSK